MAVPERELRRNRLLALLPDGVRASIGDRGELRELEIRDVIFEQDERIEHVWFPLGGVCSMVSRFEDHSVEIATIGNEGMLGLPVFLQSAYTSAHMAFCQVRGAMVRLPVGAFGDLLSQDGDIHGLLHRYTQTMFTQVAQNAACNAVHDTTQRSARWILMTHDRVGEDEFELTQEFLAQMLAVRRPAVNGVARHLQDEGLIQYARGRMTVVDREGLLETVCPCYGIVRAEYDRLLS